MYLSKNIKYIAEKLRQDKQKPAVVYKKLFYSRFLYLYRYGIRFSIKALSYRKAYLIHNDF